MAIFKALRSEKQMTTIGGRMIRANKGYYETDEKGIVDAQSKNPNWEKIEKREEIKEIPKKEKK